MRENKNNRGSDWLSAEPYSTPATSLLIDTLRKKRHHFYSTCSFDLDVGAATMERVL